jgi:hypothetical protein
MARKPVTNFGKVQVNQGYDAAATSIVLVSGSGAKLPSTFPFPLVWWNSTDYSDPSDDPLVEIVSCTARATDTLTITRAQEGTSATTKNTAGKTYLMVLAWTKAMHDDLLTGEPGTIALFQQTTAPIGWTKNATHNDKALRVVSGAVGSGGATAFTSVFGAGLTTASHTLTTAEMPAHMHVQNHFTATAGGFVGSGAFQSAPVDSGTTDSAGGGGGHTHNFTIDLQYVDIILATKD